MAKIRKSLRVETRDDIHLEKITERKLSEYQKRRGDYYATCIYRGRRDCQQNAKERTIKTRCLLEEPPVLYLSFSLSPLSFSHSLSLSFSHLLAMHRSGEICSVHQALHRRRVT